MQLSAAQSAAEILTKLAPNQVALQLVQTATNASAVITGCDMAGQPHLDLTILQLTAAESASIGAALVAVLNARITTLNAQLAAL